MSGSKQQVLQQAARERLGPHWARRLNNALDTLIDAEGLIVDAGEANTSGALAEVSNALRTLLEDRRY